jgi:peptidoglycan-associated lipoprotein
MSDASIAVGLFNRVELGTSIQHFDSEEHGGNMLGGFARVSLLPASVERLDLAVGARYLSSPSYGDNYVDGLQPGRFGHPDYRLLKEAQGFEVFNTNLTPYVVASAHALRSDGFDFTLTGGWGTGMFSAGGDRDFYAEVDAGGLFAGAALHTSLGGGRVLNLMAEFNGFDTNAGVQLDLGGIRIGGFALGLPYDTHSTYRSRKFGVLASVAFCVAEGALCDGKTEPPPPPDPGPTAAELEQIRRDSIARARAEEERRVAAEREAAERERARRAAAERRTLEEMVFFDYNQSAIREDAETALRRKVEILLARPGVQLRIDAHADERGEPEYNVRLAGERGEAVVALLVEAGVDASRFTVVSHGEESPLAQGSNEEAWARNRRVQFVIAAGVYELGR